MAIFGFNKQRSDRIGKATLAVERSLLRKKDQQPESPDQSEGFWIELTAEDEDGSYSWKLVYPSATEAEGWIDADPAVIGDHAYEANGATGLADSPHRFFAKFIGYDTDDVPYYIFVAGGATPPGTSQWFKVQAVNDPNGVVVAQPWDGVTAGAPLYVYAYRFFNIGDTFYATKINPLVDVHPDEDPEGVVEYLQLPDGTTAGALTLSGAGGTARATSWKRSEDGTPVTVEHQRINIDNTTKVISAFTFYKKYDADGLLCEVTEETAATLNTGTGCI